jgi:predicted amidohydrolase YtcJ/transglutaminase-like putative cysteine protease
MAIACAWTVEALPASGGEEPTRVWTGRIWTGDPQRPWAEALAVRGRTLLAIGSRAEVLAAAGAEAPCLSIGPGLITPGWIDARVDLFEAGRRRRSVDLRDAATRDAFVERIAQCAARLPAGAWVTGVGWDAAGWGDDPPTRFWIDAAVPHHPVWVRRADDRAALANSAALRALGIDAAAVDKAPAEYVRDAAGRLTGVVTGDALRQAARSIPEPTRDERLAALAAAGEDRLAHGVTSVHHWGSWDDLEILRAASEQGRLPVRVYACTPLSAWQRLDAEVARRGRGDARLAWGAVHAAAEDAAAFRHDSAEPFADGAAREGPRDGDEADLRAELVAADRAGLQVLVHAAGRPARRRLLDLFAEATHRNGPRDRRFRLDGVGPSSLDDAKRLASLGAGASLQPCCGADPVQRPPAAGSAETLAALRTLLAGGARVAFGGGWLGAPPSPLQNIAAAALAAPHDGAGDREDPAGKGVDVEAALRAATCDAAWSGFAEGRLGSLEPGKLADFVVVDRDLTQLPATGLAAARVWMTVVDGRIAFVDAEFSAFEAAQRDAPPIAALVDQGQFAEAERRLRPALDGASPRAREAAREAAEVLRRTRLDYPLDEASTLAAVRKSIPDASPDDLRRWSGPRDLNCRVIDGQRRYFRRGVANLLQFNAEARSRRVDDPPPPRKFALVPHLERLAAQAATADDAEFFPVQHRVRHEVTVPAGSLVGRGGAQAACWLPFPQTYRQQRAVRLLGCGPGEGRLAPDGSPHRSLYLEQQVAEPPAELKFWVEFAFVASAYCPRLEAERARPYATASPLYREFTAQRPPHLTVTSEVAALARSIVGDEHRPLEQVRLLFRWVSAEIPWRGEREYSAIPSLSGKGLETRCGDCGVQGAVFITLCRAVGIPARWQSGWETKPDDWNMHDWSEFYLEPWGWLPADASYGVQDHPDPRVRDFYCGGMDPYRLVVNLDYGRPLAPPASGFRSEPNDFQRGEVEIDGENLYFDQWTWKFAVFTTPLAE